MLSLSKHDSGIVPWIMLRQAQHDIVTQYSYGAFRMKLTSNLRNMHPFIRLIICCAAIFLLIFIGTQIFNRFCSLSQTCQPFYFSRYIPRQETGSSFGVNFDTTNSNPNLEFDAMDPHLLTVSNRMNSVVFRARNKSDHKIRFQPKLEMTPEYFAKYVTPIHCLCSQSYTLSAGEVLDLKMDFFVRPEVQNNSEFDKARRDNTSNDLITIRYRVE